MSDNQNKDNQNKLILDLTRVEGAQVLEEKLFLYPYAERVKSKINEFKRLGTEEESSEESINEFFATNVFINGKRGTGKTSILLTVYKEVKNYNDLLVLPVIDLSTNIQSVLVYILSYIKDKYFEELKADSCCGEKLDDLFYKLELNFPVFLKCFCDKNGETLCKHLCNKEIEELLDKNELNYISLLRKFFKAFLKQLNKKKLVILIDDFDLVIDEKVLVRIIVELAIFLNLKEVIIVGAGDLENLQERLFRFFRRGLNKERAKEIAKSYIEKLFSLRNIINIPPVDIYYLKNNVKIKVKGDKLLSLESLLSKHLSLKRIFKSNQHVIYYILDNLSLRQLVQFLIAVYERIKISESNLSIKLSEYLVSPIIISLMADSVPYATLLKTDFNNELMPNNNYKLKDLSPDDIWNIFKSFNDFMKALFEKERKINDTFRWRNIKEFRDNRYRFISYLKGYNRKIYSILYIWLAEMFIYFGQPIYPLITITLSFLYGLPNIIISKLKGEDSIGLLDFITYLEITDVANYISFDDSLNYLLANYKNDVFYRGKNYKDYIIFGKIWEGWRIHRDLRLYFYKLLHNTYVAYYLNLVEKKGFDFSKEKTLSQLLYDVYSRKENVSGEENRMDLNYITIYRKKLENLINYYEKIAKRFDLIYDPELLDRRVNAIIRRSIDIWFRKNVTNPNYKYIYLIYLPFLFLLLSLNEYELINKWSSLLFEEEFWGKDKKELEVMISIIKNRLKMINEDIGLFFESLIK